MTNTMTSEADRVGDSLVSGTQSLNDAVLHTCAAIISMVEAEDNTNQLGVTRRETKRLHAALGTILDARQAQLHARTASLELAKKLEIADYGAGCNCPPNRASAEDEQPVGRLALVS